MSKLVGFIGTGSMGRTLVEALIRSGALRPSEILLSNRTRSKAQALAESHPGIRIAESNAELVREANWVFLCIKPRDYREVLDEIGIWAGKDQMMISITSPVMIRDLEAVLPSKIAKIIPSITHAVLDGTCLFIPGSRLTLRDREELLRLLSAIGTPLEIDERHCRVASDLASCGPAFLAHFLEQLVRTAGEVTGLPRETAIPLVIQMARGTARMLTEGGFSLESLQERVAVPGGITREGLNLLERELNPVLNRLFRLTHAKFAEDVEKVRQSLHGAESKG
jgi:competence protein ComER